MMSRMKLPLGTMLLFGASLAMAQGTAVTLTAPVAQIVALDECEPSSFNAMLGPDFCKNIALGAVTSFSKLFKEAGDGTPDPNWDFEPDVLTVKQGTVLNVANQ